MLEPHSLGATEFPLPSVSTIFFNNKRIYPPSLKHAKCCVNTHTATYGLSKQREKLRLLGKEITFLNSSVDIINNGKMSKMPYK